MKLISRLIYECRLKIFPTSSLFTDDECWKRWTCCICNAVLLQPMQRRKISLALPLRLALVNKSGYICWLLELLTSHYQGLKYVTIISHVFIRVSSAHRTVGCRSGHYWSANRLWPPGETVTSSLSRDFNSALPLHRERFATDKDFGSMSSER